MNYSWQFYVTALEKLGLDAESLLQQCGVSLDEIREARDVVPIRVWRALLDQAVRQSGDPSLGLRVFQQMDLADLGPLGFAACNASSLAVAMQTFSRYSRLVEEGSESNHQLCWVDTAESHYESSRYGLRAALEYRSTLPQAPSC